MLWYHMGHSNPMEEHKMRFERITDTGHEMYKKAMELYADSFPPHEQREAKSQAAILGDDEYHFALACDDDTFVGEALYWEWDGYIYIEHLCILPEMRNKAYGGKVLELLAVKNKKVILEIDPPVDDISIRRRGFYERSGFTENPYPHVHPPYHRGNKGHELVVMSRPGKLSAAECDCFWDYLNGHVMKDVF